MILNLNIGILGHVDSGKTSLAKCLSTVSSTAAFDRNPQSQERGITLDLGFSSFSMPTPEHLKNTIDAEVVQYTLVDCPGHATLIKTIIGGAQIIDIVLLVVDVTKGIQTQTAECLVISEIMQKRLAVVLNKIDLLLEHERSNGVYKMKNKIQKVLSTTSFASTAVPFFAVSAHTTIGIEDLIHGIGEYSFIPNRSEEGPFVFAVDHCFGIKGQGTIITGTVLSGSVKVNDNIDIPILGLTKKVKSMQMFKQSIESASQGDRLGISVTQFDPKLLERGIACNQGCGNIINQAIIKAYMIKYFKQPIQSRSKFHITIGHETVLAKLTIFYHPNQTHFNFDSDYEYKDVVDVDNDLGNYFLLLDFDKPVFTIDDSLLIGSKLDMNIDKNTCRLAFWGKLGASSKDSFGNSLKIFRTKKKYGIVERVVNENTVIVKNIFKKETDIQKFLNLTVTFSTGETGKIEASFGQSGKIKVSVADGFNSAHVLKEKRIDVMLEFKKYLFDDKQKMYQ